MPGTRGTHWWIGRLPAPLTAVYVWVSRLCRGAYREQSLKTFVLQQTLYWVCVTARACLQGVGRVCWLLLLLPRLCAYLIGW